MKSRNWMDMAARDFPMGIIVSATSPLPRRRGWFRFGTAACTVLAAMAQFPSLGNGADGPGAALIKTLISQRVSIQSGELTLESSTHEELPMPSDHMRSWHIWFTGDRIRGDMLSNGTTETRCWGCFRPGAYVNFSNVPTPTPNTRMGVSISEAKNTSPLLGIIPPPRWLGCLPIDSMNLSELGPAGALMRITKETSTSVEGTSEGPSAQIVAWKLPGGTFSRSATFVKSEGDALTRMDSRFTASGIEYVDSIDIVNQKLSDELGWFPARWEYKRTENGKLTRSEKADVRWISINQSIDAKIFELAGIDYLRPGTSVLWNLEAPQPGGAPHGEGQLVWTGEQIAAVASTGTGAGTRWGPVFLLANVAIVLLFLALLLYRRARSVR